MAGFWLFSSDGLLGRDACVVLAAGGVRGGARVCAHVDGCGCSRGSVGAGAGRVRSSVGFLCSCLHPFAGGCGLGWFSDCVAVWRVAMLHGYMDGTPAVDRVRSCIGVSAGCSSVVPGVFFGVSCSGVVFSYGACGSFASFGVFSVDVGFCGHCLPCGCSGGCGRFGACGCSYGVAGVSACLVVCNLVLVSVPAPVLVIGRVYGFVPVCVWSAVLQAWLVSVSVPLSLSVMGCWIPAAMPVSMSALACSVVLIRVCWWGCFPLCVCGLVSGSACMFKSMLMFMPVPVVVVVLAYMVLFVSARALAGVYMYMVDVLFGFRVGLLRMVAYGYGGLLVGDVADGASAVLASPVLYSHADSCGGSMVMVVSRSYMGWRVCGDDDGVVCELLMLGWMLMPSRLRMRRVNMDMDMDVAANTGTGVHVHASTCVPSSSWMRMRAQGMNTRMMVTEGGR